MAGYGSLTLLDASNESTSTNFYTGDITALTIAAALTQFGALRAAVDGITLGTLSRESLKVFETKLSNTPPTDENAQRERKWLVVYEDTTQFFDAPINAIPNAAYRKIYTMEIGTADIVGRLLPRSDEADLTDPQITAFIGAFEAIAKSPYGGSVNVLSMRSVGRNL